MRTLLFDESFRRALKKRCKNRPELQAKMTEVLSLLETDPFTPCLVQPLQFPQNRTA
jgi:mRNA-degrading endonuclease YafQ of YafQ-DinJ toxin-antitoxin module